MGECGEPSEAAVAVLRVLAAAPARTALTVEEVAARSGVLRETTAVVVQRLGDSGWVAWEGTGCRLTRLGVRTAARVLGLVDPLSEHGDD